MSIHIIAWVDNVLNILQYKVGFLIYFPIQSNSFNSSLIYKIILGMWICPFIYKEVPYAEKNQGKLGYAFFCPNDNHYQLDVYQYQV
jgi:hypothetical protein